MIFIFSIAVSIVALDYILYDMVKDMFHNDYFEEEE